MERYDVSEGDRFAEMVSAAQAGAEVEITKNGAVVARMLPPVASPSPGGQAFLARLAELHKKLPPEIMGGDAAAEIRAMRDEDC